jgi:hypothetical protein
MSTTEATAVNTTVKAHFDVTSLTPTTGAPEDRPINILEDKITKVAATFKTTQHGRKTGCLVLTVDQAEMRRVAKNNTFNRA